MADRRDSWVEQTLDVADAGPAAPVGPLPFQRGVAQVGPRAPRGPDTLVESRGGYRMRAPRPPLRYRVRQLRRGGEWTTIGALFAFVGWGIWAISLRGGNMTVPVLSFVLVLLVGAGVFALSRLLGRVLFERTLGRGRRSAWPSHLLTGVYLAAAGVAYLGNTAWAIDAWTWLKAVA
jgi:hypothetical protein